jgi:ubiquinone/menaquinone biosynthesis C-methylase UbiE
MAASGRVADRLRATLRRGGLYYSGLYVARTMVDRLRDRMDGRLAAIERRNHVIEPWSISARRFTAADNRALWNTYDWSRRGEEWTRDSCSKERVVTELLEPNVPSGSVALEVGPGGGRWTDILRQRASRLLIVDVADRALELCRERFNGCSNIEYLLTDGRTLAVADSTVDAIWSYDVFVHINPPDTRSYFREFGRVLKPRGRAVIHHPGDGPTKGQRPGWRSDLTASMVAEFCRESGLRIVHQTRELVNEGDALSVIEKIGPM